MKFKELKLSKQIMNAIEKIGYEEATPIQELAIPAIMENKDVIGLAQTGTGKTAAFALPIIDKLIRTSKPDKKIKFLIISPTRELAVQIRDNILNYIEETEFKCSVILGGVNQESQIRVLKNGIDILVATPGRLVDLIKQKKADLSNVETIVLDEADTMLDMGFIKDVKFIISQTKEKRQTLLFSATMPKEIKELAANIMNNPITIKTKTEEITADKIIEEVYFVDTKNKTNLLIELISNKEKPSILIFTRTKHGANKLAEELSEFDIKTSVIHGNKTQSNRVKALSDFKTGKTRIMIATDIAARGIDITDLGLVINYNIPEKPEIYVHRIGRTARAGKSGKSISLCSSCEQKDLKDIEKLIKHNIAVIEHKYKMVEQEQKPKQKSRTVNANKKIVKPLKDKPKSYSSNKRNNYSNKRNNDKRGFSTTKFKNYNRRSK
ncbi:MAG: DEAD/DEAH box helicase [Bacilli bacterium]|nr:DEAD/DEAH box helicase [Bacilli bacterium]